MISIDFPYVLLFLPIIIAIIIYIATKMNTKNIRKKRIITTIRILLISCLILALSGINIVHKSKTTTTVFLVDVSDSINSQIGETNQFIKNAINQMPKNNKAGIIAFGSDAKVEQFVSERKIFSKIETTPIKTATNLEKAIQAGLALFNDDSSKRLVLLTDGEQNEGTISNMVSSINSSKVAVNVIKIDNQKSAETYVSNVIVPNNISIGDTFQIKVEIKSNIKTTAKLSLYSGKTLKSTQNVEIETGINNFIFKDTLTESGIGSYRAYIEPIDDTITVNNEYVAFTNVKAIDNILLVEGKEGQSDEFVKILNSINLNYDICLPDEAPTKLNDLLKYKEIILVDVYAEDLRKDFMNNIESYVKDYSGGVIAIGGENSFALGQYRNTALEEVLPVYMDLKGEKEIPEIAIALVIDHSGSMDYGNKYVNRLNLAQQAAVKSLETLRETDTIGVLAFDDTYSWVVDFQKAQNIENITEKILSIGIGGGTSIYPALSEAANKLKESSAKIKHIILLTDGEDGYRQYDDLIEIINDNNITLSTVAIGSGSDLNLLEELADKGNGRSYFTDIDTDVPKIFAQEIFLSAKTYLVNREFTPIITSNHEIIKDVAVDGLPKMLGYIASTKKETATSILVSDENDPILTVWQCGLGKTAAFNTDVENKWTRNYSGWEKYKLMWENIIKWCITNTSNEENSISVKQENNHAIIDFTTKDYSANTKVTAVYTDEDGNSYETQFKAIAPSKYTTDIELNKIGIYNINIRQSNNNEIVSNQNTAIAMQYSKEYTFDNDSSVLDDFLKQTNGTYITQPEEIFKSKLQTVQATVSLTNTFIYICVFLFLFDIANRRLGFIESIFNKITLSLKFNKTRKDVKIKDINVKFNKIKNKEEKDINIDDKKHSKTKKVNADKKENNILDTQELLNRRKKR